MGVGGGAGWGVGKDRSVWHMWVAAGGEEGGRMAVDDDDDDDCVRVCWRWYQKLTTSTAGI